MDMHWEGDHFLCFYNTWQHNVWRFDPSIFALPANVILLAIPNELKLAPYTATRDYGVEPEEFIKDFPIQKR